MNIHNALPHDAENRLDISAYCQPQSSFVGPIVAAVGVVAGPLHDTSLSIHAGGTGLPTTARPQPLLSWQSMTFGAAVIEPWRLRGTRIVRAFDTREDARYELADHHFAFLVLNDQEFSIRNEAQPLWIVITDALTSGARLAHAFLGASYAHVAFTRIVDGVSAREISG